jgi:hypothetical protein
MSKADAFAKGVKEAVGLAAWHLETGLFYYLYEILRMKEICAGEGQPLPDGVAPFAAVEPEYEGEMWEIVDANGASVSSWYTPEQAAYAAQVHELLAAAPVRELLPA